MEQLYMIEILLDNIRIYVNADEEPKQKSIITKIRFGPNVQFIIKENELAKDDDTEQPNTLETTENGQNYYSRSIRIGKSYVFPAHPDTILTTLSKFPLDLEVWTDDDDEDPVYVGNGAMRWDRQFYRYVKSTTDPRKVHEGFTLKSRTMLYAECCCAICGEVYILLRLTALGPSITTEFQELKKSPGHFVFRTNKAPTMLDCVQIDGENPNFCMIGCLYETTTLQEPNEEDEEKVQTCTELENCAMDEKDARCNHDEEETKKEYPIEKIRMGDIKGPCGNTNCPLAHKVKRYIRSLDKYKEKAGGIGKKDGAEKNVCGKCVCKDDRWHRKDCPTQNEAEPETEKKAVVEPTCCEEKPKPKGSCSGGPHVGYVFNVPDGFKEAVYGKGFVLQDGYDTESSDDDDDDVDLSDLGYNNINHIINYALTSQSKVSPAVCGCIKGAQQMTLKDNVQNNSN